MKEIELTQGYKTIVDDEDYEYLSQWKWCVRAKPDGRRIAVRAERISGTTNGKRNFQMHRVIMNCPKDMVVDHINGNPLDNRRENLRVCTIQQNSMNRRTQTTGKFRSRYKGVGWDKDRQQWFSRIYIDNKPIVNRHTSEEEAAMAYNEKAKKYHGEYALLNIID